MDPKLDTTTFLCETIEEADSALEELLESAELILVLVEGLWGSAYIRVAKCDACRFLKAHHHNGYSVRIVRDVVGDPCPTIFIDAALCPEDEIKLARRKA